MIRWLKFNAVGLMGVVVQLAVLEALVKLGLHYLASTAIAVELAVLHNYAWHTRWTWKERGPANAGNLWRFHLGNGFLSLLSNVALMRVFTGWIGMPVLPASFTAITLTSFLNFFVGDWWVFSGTDDRYVSPAIQVGKADDFVSSAIQVGKADVVSSAIQERQATKDDGPSHLP